jgi:hypothetical protein
MIEVRVAENYPVDCIDIWVRETIDGQRRFLHYGDGRWEWAEPGAEPQPTLRLPDHAGRALLEQLTRHYSGAQDLHMVRADLLHERGRVDALIATVSDLAQIGARR